MDRKSRSDNELMMRGNFDLVYQINECFESRTEECTKADKGAKGLGRDAT